MTCRQEDLVIQKGKTFSRILRWETEPFIYDAITAIAQSAPALITVPGHTVPDGWRVAIVSVVGMEEINAANSPPRSGDFERATFVSGSQIELNEVNASDFSAYESGGYVQYFTPQDMTGYTARMDIRATITSPTTLLELNTNPPGPDSRIIVDNALKTIVLTISAVDTVVTWKSAVYDLELVSPAGVVTQLLKGRITVEAEVTL